MLYFMCFSNTQAYKNYMLYNFVAYSKMCFLTPTDVTVWYQTYEGMACSL